MRILQVCADRGIAPGSTKGAAQHLRGVAAGLAALGHSVVTAAARSAEGAFPVPVVDLGELGRGHRPAVGFDVVYERYSLGHAGGLAMARAAGRPFVLEVNAPLVAEAAAYRLATVPSDAADVEARLLAEADLVVAVSTDLARWVQRHRPPSSGGTVVVANGFEPAWFTEAARPELDGPLVFLGHPKPWHGADRLPALVAGLVDRWFDPELLVIGGGPGTEAIASRAIELGVADRLRVTGAVAPAQASAMLASGSVGLAPYRRLEPFYFCPLKVIDYAAAGLPVVASDQGDIARLVGSGGVLVDPDSDTALVEATASLLADPDRRRRLGRAGRSKAWAERSWVEAARATVARIEAIASPTVPRPTEIPA